MRSMAFAVKLQLGIILHVVPATCFIKKSAQLALHNQAHWSFIQKTVCTSLSSLVLMKSLGWLYLGSSRNLFLQLFYSSFPAVIFLGGWFFSFNFIPMSFSAGFHAMLKSPFGTGLCLCCNSSFCWGTTVCSCNPPDLTAGGAAA